MLFICICDSFRVMCLGVSSREVSSRSTLRHPKTLATCSCCLFSRCLSICVSSVPRHANVATSSHTIYSSHLHESESEGIRPRWTATATSCHWGRCTETPVTSCLKLFEILYTVWPFCSFLHQDTHIARSCKGCSSAKSFAVKACRPAFVAWCQLMYAIVNCHTQVDLKVHLFCSHESYHQQCSSGSLIPVGLCRTQK